MDIKMELITIVTPVYNRAELLGRLYRSLQEQSSKNFIWMIVDDGSTDTVLEVVSDFQKNTDFKIEFYQKNNGGKHTALNFAFPKIATELTFIVDSDDYLTSNAIEVIEQNWENGEKEVAGISFLRGYNQQQVIGTKFPGNGNYNGLDIMFKYHVTGDKAEVFRSDILKQYRFPEFEGERFCGEDYIWRQIYLKYNMLYSNDIIYITEYLPGGLTKQGRLLRISCPYGGMENSKVSFDKRFPLKERIKRAWLFICYGKFAGLSFSEIVKRSEQPLLVVPNYIFGFLLYVFWRLKYLK